MNAGIAPIAQLGGLGLALVGSRGPGYFTFGYGVTISVGPQTLINCNIIWGVTSKNGAQMDQYFKEAYGR